MTHIIYKQWINNSMLLFKILVLTFSFANLSSCTEVNNYYATEGLGKVNVYIEGNITNEQAQAKLATEIGTITENIYIENTSVLNNIALEVPTTIRKIAFSNNTALQQIAIHGIGSMPFCSLSVGGKVVENITINGITELQNVMISGATTNATTLLCHDLVKINSEFSCYFSNSYTNSMSFFDLEEVSPSHQNFSTWEGKFSVFHLPVLTTLSEVEINLTIPILQLPELEQAIAITAGYYGYLGIQHIYFPNLTHCSFLKFRDDSKQVVVDLPALTFCLNYQTRIGLESAGVNALLHKFLTIQPPSGKNIFVEEDGPPTGQGLLDKQTLINQGNQVVTN
ncbi:hypothetical protein [Flavobacterium branchiophilum]|uniref:Lipoprotein n=1 Tax=Flavobacterium branchiophilum TaxID=55197 RepID=A0A2H3KF42_9FLAO|nr:hypothetical protein [Flavobacterium branchiophilum]PDS27070.1 hypothetical protein B0A77_00635 [Flavobacterium branchiophilum]